MPAKALYYVANVAENTLYKPGHATREAAYRDAQQRYAKAKAELCIVEVIAEIAPVVMIQEASGAIRLMGPDGTIFEGQAKALPRPQEQESEAADA